MPMLTLIIERQFYQLCVELQWHTHLSHMLSLMRCSGYIVIGNYACFVPRAITPKMHDS